MKKQLIRLVILSFIFTACSSPKEKKPFEYIHILSFNFVVLDGDIEPRILKYTKIDSNMAVKEIQYNRGDSNYYAFNYDLASSLKKDIDNILYAEKIWDEDYLESTMETKYSNTIYDGPTLSMVVEKEEGQYSRVEGTSVMLYSDFYDLLEVERNSGRLVTNRDSIRTELDNLQTTVFDSLTSDFYLKRIVQSTPREKES